MLFAPKKDGTLRPCIDPLQGFELQHFRIAISTSSLIGWWPSWLLPVPEPRHGTFEELIHRLSVRSYIVIAGTWRLAGFPTHRPRFTVARILLRSRCDLTLAAARVSPPPRLRFPSIRNRT